MKTHCAIKLDHCGAQNITSRPIRYDQLSTIKTSEITIGRADRDIECLGGFFYRPFAFLSGEKRKDAQYVIRSRLRRIFLEVC